MCNAFLVAKLWYVLQVFYCSEIIFNVCIGFSLFLFGAQPGNNRAEEIISVRSKLVA